MSQTESPALQRTSLYDLHLELGAKMVPFAGYEMPVQYPLGVLNEHLHCRQRAGLFDVSHMGQVVVSGAGAVAGLESLLPIDLDALDLNRQVYAVMTDDRGGILDDLIVTRWGEQQFFLVINAACKDQDVAHLRAHLAGCDLEVLAGRALLALQGPAARAVMAELSAAAAKLTFMSGCRASIDGADCYITCSGYTGEDGFELSVAAEDAERVARHLLSFDAVAAIGLGARDSLRLEAGLCLYGNDMDQSTTPVEAGLAWSIGKTRRANGDKAGGFPGADIILAQMASGPGRKRVGLAVDGKAPVRAGTELLNADGEIIGRVCSGGFGPSVDRPVAMGYVPSGYAEPGTSLLALVRGKTRPVTVVKTPFVPQRYFRG